MSAIVTITHQHSAADEWETSGTMSPGVYATGGVPFTPRQFGFTTLRTVFFPSVNYWEYTPGSFTTVTGVIDWKNLKLLMYSGQTENVNATDMSTLMIPFTARGIV